MNEFFRRAICIVLFLAGCAHDPDQKSSTPSGLESVANESQLEQTQQTSQEPMAEKHRSKTQPWPDKFLVRGDLIVNGRRTQKCEYTLLFERNGIHYDISGGDKLFTLPKTQDPKIFDAVVRKFTCLLPRFTVRYPDFEIVGTSPIESTEEIRALIEHFFAATNDSSNGQRFFEGSIQRIKTNMLMVWFMLLPAPDLLEDAKPDEQLDTVSTSSGHECISMSETQEETKDDTQHIRRELSYCYSPDLHLHLNATRAVFVDGKLTDDTTWTFVVHRVEIVD